MSSIAMIRVNYSVESKFALMIDIPNLESAIFVRTPHLHILVMLEIMHFEMNVSLSFDISAFVSYV